MKISSNLIRFHNELGLKKTIDIFSEAGFEGIDFNADMEEYYTDAHDKEFYTEIKKYANDRGIAFSQTHAPFVTSFLEEEKSQKRFNEIVKSMEHSSYLGADMIVVHSCGHNDYKKDNNYDMMLQYNYDFYKKLIPYAEKYNLKIAIENIATYITEAPEALLQLVNALNNDVITICCDVGHFNIRGYNPAEAIRTLGKHIGCTHIHDNDGEQDLHILPYSGAIDWESVMKALADVDYKGNLSYEAGYFVKTAPVAFRRESAKYMAVVAKYLVERFEYYKAI